MQSGAAFDRGAMEQTLASLGNRVFLMNNVHDDSPTIFQSRWALSFLAGPLARDKIALLMQDRKRAKAVSEPIADAASSSTASLASSAVTTTPSRPVVPNGISEKFLAPTIRSDAGAKQIYRPAIYGEGSAHYVRASSDLDQWQDIHLLLHCASGVPATMWEASTTVTNRLDWDEQADDAFSFADLPDELRGQATYKELDKRLKDYLFRHHSLSLYKSPALGRMAPAGSTEGEARIFFTHGVRELRDLESEKVRAKFATRAKALEKKIREAGERLSREQAELSQASWTTAINMGTTVLGAFFGKKLGSRSNVTKTSTAMRGATKAAQERSDVQRAEDAMRELQIDLDELNQEIKIALDEVAQKYDVANIELEEVTVPARKADLKTRSIVLLWTPWQIDSHGIATPLFSVNE